jgi:hypothetical protein
MAEQPKALPDPCPADDPISNRPITLAQAGIDKHPRRARATIA